MAGPRRQQLLALARDGAPANALRFAVNFRGQRRVIARRYVFDALARITPRVAVDVDGLRVYLNTSDKAVSRSIFARGLYERELFTSALSVLKRGGSNGRIDGHFLDIGANIGTATCLALKQFGASQAWTFEPSPDNVDVLRHNVLANGLQQLVYVHPCALSDRDGAIELELSHDNWGDHRVRVVENTREPGLLDEESRDTIEVPCRRLDALVEAGSLEIGSVGLAWIDVQGHEAHVLGGASALLDSQVPIICEYWPYGLRRAGGLDRFHELVLRYRDVLVDLGAPRSGAMPAADLPRLATRYRGLAFTDLLLL